MRVLIISADQFEDSELSEPLQHLMDEGAIVDLAAPSRGTITGKHGYSVEAGVAINEVQVENYDLLLLPGGKAPAKLQTDDRAVTIARYFMETGKPVAAICHGPQILIATGLMKGRSATCYRGIANELKAAGANYLDREVVIDGNLITSRQPSDLPAFIQAIFSALSIH